EEELLLDVLPPGARPELLPPAAVDPPAIRFQYGAVLRMYSFSLIAPAWRARTQPSTSSRVIIGFSLPPPRRGPSRTRTRLDRDSPRVRRLGERGEPGGPTSAKPERLRGAH